MPPSIQIKLSFIPSLKEVVLAELKKYSDFRLIKHDNESIYVNPAVTFDIVKKLRSISRAYIITEDEKYNPIYISNHKFTLGNLIEKVLEGQKGQFKTFKITCAGAGSPEVKEISKYVNTTFNLNEAEEADLKIHIIKIDNIWEIGVQITPRPISVRDYRIANMSGAMDPSTAYAMNYFCELDKAESYLNIFSGSGTLLIEAGQCYPNLKNLIGFDNDKKHISLSIQNITKAGLIKRVQVKEKDIFDNPDLGLGKFDAITSDLPFGMAVSKGDDLEKLYKTFMEYCGNNLKSTGKLAIYTSEYEIMEPIINKSDFKIIKTLEFRNVTAVGSYLRTKMIVCEFKK